jgi:fucose 4-O-acetylase-like acetyltransferase
MKKARRILWIDMAKALAMILVVVGHCFEFGTDTRNFIFSFHMPLFLLLSGFTYHDCSTKEEWKEKTKKDALELLLPLAAILLIQTVNNACRENITVIASFLERLGALFWASGVEVHGAGSLGEGWFLVSLFCGRFLMRAGYFLFGEENRDYMGLFAGLLAILLKMKHPLPLDFDVTLMVLCFLVLGHIAKKYQAWMQEHRLLLFIGSQILWTMCLHKGIYLEMAQRSYPYGFLCIAEAAAGSYVVCQFCRTICISFRRFGRICARFGRETLLLFTIHAVDKTWIECWNGTNPLKMSVKRLCIDLFFMFLIYICMRLCARIKSNVKKNK